MNKQTINIFLSIIILYSSYCAVTSGLSWDEGTHLIMGFERLNYFLSLGLDKIDRSVLTIQYYPGLTFTVAAFFTTIFPSKFEIEILHLVNLFFSIAAIFGIYNLSKVFFNKAVARIAFLITFFNPIFFGHMFMNPKDTVVTSSYVWIIFFIIKYLKDQLNNEKRKKIILYISLIGVLGMGARLAFWGTLLPVVLFIFIDIFYFKKFTCKNFSKKYFFFDIFKIFVISYFVLVLFWPETHGNIIFYPTQYFFETLGNFKNYGLQGQSGAGMPMGLMNGEYFYANSPPKNYLLINLLYKLPEYIILSYIFFIFFIFLEKNNFKKFYSFFYKVTFIVLIFLSANLMHIFNPYPTYDGLRHFLYIMPLLSIIPALTIYMILLKVNNFKFKTAGVILSCLILLSLYKFLTIAPYQYIYLNLFAGKSKEHSTKFENDYWNISLKELISKSSFLNQKRIKLTVCGIEREHVKIYLKKFNYSKVMLVRHDEEFDYIIMNNRVTYEDIYSLESASTCFQKYKGSTITFVERNGLVISQIKKNNI